MADWTPADITTEIWLDANDATTITKSGDDLTQWDDKSGNGNHYEQTAGTSAPHTGTRTLDTKNVIDFDGTNHWLDAVSGTTWDGDSDSIILCVVDLDDRKPSRIFNNRVGGGTRLALLYNGSSALTYQHANTYNPVVKTAGLTDGPLMLGGYRSATTEGVGQNGETSYSAWAGGADVTGLDTRYIGTFNGSTDMFDGGLAELVFVKSYSLDTRQKLEGYLAHKWGLEGDLPSGHPYKSTAPQTGTTVTATSGTFNFPTVSQIISAVAPITVTTTAGTFNFPTTSHTVATSAIEWTPADITTEVWLDASDAGTITTSGDDVTQWDDKSGNNYDYTQAVGANAPHSGTRALDSKNVVDFDGTDDYLNLSSGFQPGSSDAIVIGVFMLDDTGPLSASQRIFSNHAGAGTRFGLFQYDEASSDYSSFTHDASFTVTNATFESGNKLFGGYRDGTTIGVGFDGDTYTTSSSGGTVPTLTSWILGAYYDGTSTYSQYLDGAIGEIVYVKSYSLDTRQKLEGYLAHKWGLEGDLPVGHPYKSAAPASSTTVTATAGTFNFPTVSHTITAVSSTVVTATAGTFSFPIISHTIATSANVEITATAGTFDFPTTTHTISAVSGTTVTATAGTFNFPTVAQTIVTTSNALIAATAGTFDFPLTTHAIASAPTAIVATAGTFNFPTVTDIKVGVFADSFATNHREAILFGGENDTRVFMYGNKNRFIYSELADGNPSAEYFPESNEVYVSSDNFDITAMNKQYGKLIIHKENETHYSTYEINATLGTIFSVFPLNDTVGNVSFGEGRLVQNNPFTVTNKGIQEFVGTNVREETNARSISDRVQLGLDDLDLTNAVTYDFERNHEYLVSVGTTVYVFNYLVNAWYKYSLADEPSCFIEIEKELYFGTSNGAIMKFDSTALTDNGTTINSSWETGFMEFGSNYLRKFLTYAWISMQPEGKSLCNISWETDQGSSSIDHELSYNIIDFGNVDFGNFSFNTNYNPKPFRKKLKAKKFSVLKIKGDNNSSDERMTILNITLPVNIGGQVK